MNYPNRFKHLHVEEKKSKIQQFLPKVCYREHDRWDVL